MKNAQIVNQQRLQLNRCLVQTIVAVKEYVTQPQANVHAIQGGKELIVQVRNNFYTCSELQWLSNKKTTKRPQRPPTL